MDAMPNRINRRWLEGRRGILQITTRTLHDGSPNPSRVELEAEVSEATAELERWEVFEGWVKAHLGMFLNVYPLRTGGQTYEPGQVFMRKDKTFMTRQEAWEKYTEAQARVQGQVS